MQKSKSFYKIAAIAFPIQILMIKWLGKHPKLVNHYYSNGIYTYLSKLERWLFGWIPFSVGDVLYAILVLIIIRFLYKKIKNKTFFSKGTVIHSIGFLSLIYFSFNLLWGLNYYRTPLYKTLNLNNEKVTREQLLSFAHKLIAKTNSMQVQITKNDTIAVTVPYNFATVFEKSRIGFKQLQNDFSGIDINTSSQKKSLYSLPQIYMGFTGYINPFTAEAQVNYLIPKVNLPATTCHEMAHQMGYASETEANFIGFMAASKNPDLYFQYSAYFMALRYTLNEIHYKYPKDFEELIKQLNRGIIKNQAEIQNYYKQYKLPFSLHSKTMYDYYLKANNQDKGIRSYQYMVYLLVKYNNI
jgi:hypothetical protein